MSDKTFEERQYPLPSKIIKANMDLLCAREAVGLRKYGHTLDRKDLSHREFLQHGLEEALDLSNYLQAAIQRSEAHERAYDDLLAAMQRVIGEEQFNGIRSSTDVTRRLMEVLTNHKLRYPLSMLKP